MRTIEVRSVGFSGILRWQVGMPVETGIGLFRIETGHMLQALVITKTLTAPLKLGALAKVPLSGAPQEDLGQARQKTLIPF